MKEERLYTVRMSYDITLEASSETDAIHSAHYASLNSYQEAIENLSQSVIAVKPKPIPQPDHSALPEPIEVAEGQKPDDVPY